jgi:hypothetical protein
MEMLETCEFLVGKNPSGDFLAISWANFGHQNLYWRKIMEL